jgi:hypothetical protein
MTKSTATLTKQNHAGLPLWIPDVSPQNSPLFFAHIKQLAAIIIIILVASRLSISAAQDQTKADFNDSHFHLTNYVQQGITIDDYLKIMGDRVGRSTLFGIPLQQMWSYRNSGDDAPTYYLHTDAPLYYYSFCDA